MKKLFLVITLMAGLRAHADTPPEQCLFRGHYDLQVFPWSVLGALRPKFVEGTVGGDSIHWRIRGEENVGDYFVLENYKGQLIHLTIQLHSRPQSISGWAGKQRIDWMGEYGWFVGDQPLCP